MGKLSKQKYRSPVEAPDSLFSKQRALVLDVVSEGPIGGLLEGAKGIALDGTPVRHKDGGYNYRGISYETRLGTPSDDPHKLMTGTGRVVDVNQELTRLNPKGKGPGKGTVTRQINDGDVTHLGITFAVNGLYRQETENQKRMGDTGPAEVTYKVVIADADGQLIKDYSGRKKGKTTGRVEWEVQFALSGKAPWTVQVEKTSKDSEKSTLKNDLYWARYTERKSYKLQYPHSATVLLAADAQTLGGRIPQRTYRVAGRLVDVPVNYDPETRAYTGIWDGTFKQAVTDNPAWIFRDILVNDRYGLAHWLGEDLRREELTDKWALYSVARFCDELIDDGHGGRVPRYTFNGQIMGAGAARDVVQAMASAFHGMAYWNTGQIYARADRPNKPVKLINQTNVIGGRFAYTTGSYSERHSAALVSYTDQSDYGKPKTVYVPNSFSRKGAPPRELRITAYGCGDEGQAWRHGLWALLSETEDLLCTCEVGLDCLDLLPGDAVLVSDPLMAGLRWGGRVKKAEGRSVTVDSEIPPAASVIYITCADGSVQRRRIVKAEGVTLTVNEDLPAVQPLAPFAAAADAVSPKLFSVQELKEKETGRYELTLRAVNEEKFKLLQSGTPQFEQKPWRDKTARPLPKLHNLRARESSYISGGALQNRITLSWDAPSTGVAGFEVQATTPNGSTDTVQTEFYSVDYPAAAQGHYTFKACCRAADGRRGDWATLEYDAQGHSPQPQEPKNVKAKGGLRSVTVTWDMSADAATGFYEVLISETERVEDAKTAGRILASSFTVQGLKILTTYWAWVQAVDITGKVKTAPVGGVSAVTDALTQEDIPKAVITESHLAESIKNGLTQDAIARDKADKLAEKVDELKAELATTSAQAAKEAQTLLQKDLAAEAKARETLEAKLNDRAAKVEQIIQTQIGASSLDDAAENARALYQINTNVNGHAVGFGLANEGDKGSQFVVVADHLIVATPDGGTQPMFDVNKDGVNIAGDLIANGSITGEKLNARSRINLADGGELVIGDKGLIQVGENVLIDSQDGGRILTTGEGANPKYSVLTGGDIEFYEYIGGSYHLSKMLKNIDNGVAKSGSTVTLRGVWADVPSIMVSPLDVPTTNKDWGGRTQYLKVKVQNIRHNPKTGKVTFSPVAMLSVGRSEEEFNGASASFKGNDVLNRGLWGNSKYTLTAEQPALPKGTTKVTVSVTAKALRSACSGQGVYDVGDRLTKTTSIGKHTDSRTAIKAHKEMHERINTATQRAYRLGMTVQIKVGNTTYEVGRRIAPKTKEGCEAPFKVSKTITLPKALVASSTPCSVSVIFNTLDANGTTYSTGGPTYRYTFSNPREEDSRDIAPDDREPRWVYTTSSDVLSKTDIYSHMSLDVTRLVAHTKEDAEVLPGTLQYIAIQ